MVTQKKARYQSFYKNAEYIGLSTDDKSTIEANNGDEMYEMDTGKTFIYNEEGKAWVQQV